MNKEEIAIYIGSKIREYRKLRKMTQEELGKRLSIGKSTIANYEKGFRSPKKEMIFQIAEVLSVSIDDLFPKISSSGSSYQIYKSDNISKTVEIMKNLEEPRQKLVLDTANSQLKEQKEEQERKKVISLPNDDTSPLTEDELQEAVDQAVAFDGKPFDDREKEIVKQLLRQAWEEKHGRG